jgi:hypothetical protein
LDTPGNGRKPLAMGCDRPFEDVAKRLRISISLAGHGL